MWTRITPNTDIFYAVDLSDSLTINARFFADDVLLFSVVDDMNLSGTKLNNDLNKVNASPNQWNIIFNPDLNKQAQDVIFLVK